MPPAMTASARPTGTPTATGIVASSQVEPSGTGDDPGPPVADVTLGAHAGWVTGPVHGNAMPLLPAMLLSSTSAPVSIPVV